MIPKGKFLLSCWETQTFTIFDLEIRSVKGGNKKNLPWNTAPIDMHSGFISNSTSGKPDYFLLALENLTQNTDSGKRNQQSKKWEDTDSLVPLNDFNTIL